AGMTLLAGGTARATFPGPDGRIAFWDFMTRQIYAVNPDGTGLVQLTNVAEGQTAADPAWSPDSHHIAFDSDMSGSPRLWIMDADGGNAHQVGSDRPRYADFSPKFTPDGERLVYTRCQPDGGCAIFSVRIDGTDRRAI